MKPSFSPRRVTADEKTGSPCFDREVVHWNDGRRRLSTNDMVQGFVQAVVTGLVIAVVLCPVLIGFASIIFAHPDFAPDLPRLNKLLLLSSVVHQVVISALSPVSYAIGQCQDAGLIFLSSMASSITTQLALAHVPLDERISSVMVQLSCSTILVGIGLVVVGKLRLASFVQYLPTPVIGGYLAFIGFFLVKGSLAMMTGIQLTGLRAWLNLLDTSQMILYGPGLFAAVFLSFMTSKYHHFAVFPGCLVLLPVLFFAFLALCGIDLPHAREMGLMANSTQTISLFDVYALVDVTKVHWTTFPSLLPTLLSMFVVIAFGSSLDIASINMGTGSNMHYDQQLQTVGFSNVVSGLCGGYTGSYIFSQSLFSFRFHPRHMEQEIPGFARLVGLSLGFWELMIVVLPVCLTAFVPKFLFGAVMMFIGIELLKCWLVGVAFKLLVHEYAIVLVTFVMLLGFGVQWGLASGIIVSSLWFIIEYSQHQVVRVVYKSSNAIRNAEQYALLFGNGSGSAKAPKESDSSTSNLSLESEREVVAVAATLMKAIVTIELQGHIFFGSATRILDGVKQAVVVHAKEQRRSLIPITSGRGALGDESLPLVVASCGQEHDSVGYGSLLSHHSISGVLTHLDGSTCECDQSCHAIATRFIVFDFSRVTGMDASAARTCFVTLKMLFLQHNLRAVYCGMQPSMRFLLEANDVLPPSTDEVHTKVTSDVDLALEWCEHQLLQEAHANANSLLHPLSCGSVNESHPSASGRSSPRHRRRSTQPPRELALDAVLKAYLSPERKVKVSMTKAFGQLQQHFVIREWAPNETIFSLNDTSTNCFVLLSGQVTIYQAKKTSTSRSDHEVVGRVRPGCLFGDLDFVLDQRRTMEAVVSSSSNYDINLDAIDSPRSTTMRTITAQIDRKTMNQLIETDLETAFVLQEVILRASHMSIAEKLHAIVI